MNFEKNKSGIIFGANGYIGGHLSAFLISKGWDIQNCDIHQSSDLPNYQKVDITNFESLSKLEYDVDFIFFFSGLTGTSLGFKQYRDFINVNEIGLLNLLDIIKGRVNKPRIIFPSTRLVYKGKDTPLKEEDAKNPKTIYAVNKLACEEYLQIYNNAFGIPYTIFRICVPYGNLLDHNYSFGTIGFFMNKATNGEPISIYGGGEYKRTFTYISDICEQINHCISISQSLNQIYNIGGETYSLKEVAELIAQKYRIKVISVDWPAEDLKIESGHTYFDDSKLRELTGEYEYTKLSSFNWLK